MKNIIEIEDLSATHPILLFDGVCNLCNHYVQFVIKNDKQARFRFASLQSEIGQTILSAKKMDRELSTVVLLDAGKIYTHSDVALQIMWYLGGGWKLFYFLIIIPKFFRDWIYNWIAKNRYRWFGEKESCMIPTPELKGRFIDA